MSIEYFLVLVYMLVFFWRMPASTVVKKSGLTTSQIRLLAAFKIFTGLVCAYYFKHFSTALDYQYYNEEGLTQYQILIAKPSSFFTDFIIDLETYGVQGIFNSEYSFWAYLRFNLIFKFIGLLNILTHGNFYLNSMLFSSLTFWGHLAFYRIYSEMYPIRKIIIIVITFLLPSILLYTSCVHKDGLIFICLAGTSFIMFKILTLKKTVNISYVSVLALCLFFIFLLRNYILVALLPAIATSICYLVLPFKKRPVIFLSYLFYGIAFFLSGYTRLSLPAAVVQRKEEFATLLGGRTNIPMSTLQPTLTSFAFNMPEAINHFFLRPYIWEFSQLPVILSALELVVYQLIFLCFIFFRRKSPPSISPYTIFGLALLFNMALIIGYTIPNIGAIVRYRSIFWIFIIGPAIGNIDWARLNALKMRLFI